MAENRITEANNQGQEDGARALDEWKRDPVGSTVKEVLGVYYNPPSDPDEKEAYDAGYRNACGPTIWDILF